MVTFKWINDLDYKYMCDISIQHINPETDKIGIYDLSQVSMLDIFFKRMVESYKEKR